MNFIYSNFKVQSAEKQINLASDALNLALFTSAYAPQQDTDATYGGITGEVPNGNGYATGGVALTGVAVGQDSANHRMKLTANNPSWANATFTARYGVLYHAATGDLIALYDFGGNQTAAGGTFSLTWDQTNGVLVLA